MYKFYINKQEQWNKPFELNNEQSPFTYITVTEITFHTVSSNLLIVSDNKMYYSFLSGLEPKLKFLNKEKREYMLKNYFPINDLSEQHSYCEISYEQCIDFLSKIKRTDPEDERNIKKIVSKINKLMCV